MRGKLGFADSFVHSRLGVLVLSKLIERESGAQKQSGESLRIAFHFMLERLNFGKPRMVLAQKLEEWYIYSDASYEQNSKTGGVGGVLVDAVAQQGHGVDIRFGALWSVWLVPHGFVVHAHTLSYLLADRLPRGHAPVLQSSRLAAGAFPPCACAIIFSHWA